EGRLYFDAVVFSTPGRGGGVRPVGNSGNKSRTPDDLNTRVSPMNIAGILTEQAAIRPEAAAIIDGRGGRSRITSFRQMERASGSAAALLSGAGLRAGDHVLVLQPMSAELYIALIAIFRLGLVAMFFDPSAGRDHITACCEMTPPRAFIGSAKAQLLC